MQHLRNEWTRVLPRDMATTEILAFDLPPQPANWPGTPAPRSGQNDGVWARGRVGMGARRDAVVPIGKTMSTIRG